MLSDRHKHCRPSCTPLTDLARDFVLQVCSAVHRCSPVCALTYAVFRLQAGTWRSCLYQTSCPSRYHPSRKLLSGWWTSSRSACLALARTTGMAHSVRRLQVHTSARGLQMPSGQGRHRPAGCIPHLNLPLPCLQLCACALFPRCFRGEAT